MRAKHLVLLLAIVAGLFMASCQKDSANKDNPAGPVLHQPPKCTLTVQIDPPAAGQVSVTPVGTIFDSGTVVSLLASPESSYVFSQWALAASGTNPAVQVVMNKNTSIMAQFLPASGANSNVLFLYAQVAAADTIDSTGTYYKSNDTTFWVMKDSTGRLDTVSAHIGVTGDSARVANMMISPLPRPLTITGALAHGPGGAFEGSVWKVASISTDYQSVIFAAVPAPGTAMYLYFNPANNKVYVLQNGKALAKLEAGLLLQCPLAFYSPLLSLTGFTIDTVKSDCDTIWAQMVTSPTVTLDGYVVGNTAAQTLDFYVLPLRMKMYSIPLY